MTKSRVIVVSNRLPVKVTEKNGHLELKRSDGGLATALSSIGRSREMLWIGWPGNERKLSRRELDGLKLPKLLIPVQMSKRLVGHYYHKLANGVLWPLMHEMEPVRWNTLADWQATGEATARFAEAVINHWRPGDSVWVHDFHLALLPGALRDRGMGGRLGFFLHTPFPKPGAFTAWPHYLEILQSLCRADVVGLQTQRDVRNFKAALAGAGLHMRRGAVVKSFPIGVDFSSFRSAETQRGVRGALRRWRSLKSGSQLVLSVSRLDYIKGIVEQLKAMEQVLSCYPPGTLRYKLIVAPSRDNLREYKALKQEVEQTVEQINAHFLELWGVEPVDFEYRSYGFDELNALYRLADVLLATPIIEGMNLVVKEYVAARGAKLGAVVLSRTAGVAYQLRDCVRVDPADVGDIARGLRHALDMRLVEQAWRWQAVYRNVREQDVFWWAEKFLSALEVKRPAPVVPPALLRPPMLLPHRRAHSKLF